MSKICVKEVRNYSEILDKEKINKYNYTILIDYLDLVSSGTFVMYCL